MVHGLQDGPDFVVEDMSIPFMPDFSRRVDFIGLKWSIKKIQNTMSTHLASA